jgi:hypothetical protein
MSEYQSNVIEVKIQYDGNKAPDYKAISAQIDEHLRKHFKGQKIVVHAISSEDHHDRNIEDVLKDLIQHGTEKAEVHEKGKQPDKKSNYDFLGNYHAINDKSNVMDAFENDDQLKVDLIAVYDPEHVEKTTYSDKSKGVGDAYKFKHPDKKPAALKGVLKIVYENKPAEGKKPEAAQKQQPQMQQDEDLEEEIEEAESEYPME